MQNEVCQLQSGWTIGYGIIYSNFALILLGVHLSSAGEAMQTPITIYWRVSSLLMIAAYLLIAAPLAGLRGYRLES